MKRTLGMLLLGLLVFLPAVVVAETFDVFHCKAGTFALLHDSKELPPIATWEENGIFLSPNGDSVFKNIVVRCVGFQQGRNGPSRSGDGFCKLVDPDGDLIIVSLPYRGEEITWRFVAGTGKWKGITGSGKTHWVAHGKRAMPGTFQRCTRFQGSYELAK